MFLILTFFLPFTYKPEQTLTTHRGMSIRMRAEARAEVCLSLQVTAYHVELRFVASRIRRQQRFMTNVFTVIMLLLAAKLHFKAKLNRK